MQNNLNFLMVLSDFRYEQPNTDGERFFGENAIFRYGHGS